MWQRFTERARKIIFYAQEEAQRFGEGYVSTEHLLLGLTREDDSTAARILDTLGVGLADIRKKVEDQLPRGDSRPSQDMTLTPRAKRVIDLAYDEARNLNNNYIGTEHLLLGLIREDDGLAARVLFKLGVRLEDARRATMAFQDTDDTVREPESWIQRMASGMFKGRDPRAVSPFRLFKLRQRRGLHELLTLLAMSWDSAAIDEMFVRLDLNPDVFIVALEDHLSMATVEEAKPLAKNLLQVAAEEATVLGQPLGPEHLLLALAAGENRWAELLAARNLTADDLRAALVNPASPEAGD